MNQIATCLIIIGLGIGCVMGFFAELVRIEAITYLGDDYIYLYNFQKKCFQFKYMQSVKIPKSLRNDYFGCVLISYFGALLIFVAFLLMGRFLWALTLFAYILLITFYTRNALKSAFLGDETN